MLQYERLPIKSSSQVQTTVDSVYAFSALVILNSNLPSLVWKQAFRKDDTCQEATKNSVNEQSFLFSVNVSKASKLMKINNVCRLLCEINHRFPINIDRKTRLISLLHSVHLSTIV